MKKIFITDLEELQEKECKYNLEDCGMSGDYPDYHWLQDDDADVAIYYKLEE